jgi:hypothetical protein
LEKENGGLRPVDRGRVPMKRDSSLRRLRSE